jgi:hypothetical protein
VDFKRVLEACGIRYSPPSDIQYLGGDRGGGGGGGEAIGQPMQRVYTNVTRKNLPHLPQLILVVLAGKEANNYRQVSSNPKRRNPNAETQTLKPLRLKP